MNFSRVRCRLMKSVLMLFYHCGPFFIPATQSGSKSDPTGDFPSSDKQPYLKVTAHLNINKCARSLRAHPLAVLPAVINGPGQPSATSRNEPC